MFLFLYSYIFICAMVWCFLGAPKGQLLEINLNNICRLMSGFNIGKFSECQFLENNVLSQAVLEKIESHIL